MGRMLSLILHHHLHAMLCPPYYVRIIVCFYSIISAVDETNIGLIINVSCRSNNHSNINVFTDTYSKDRIELFTTSTTEIVFNFYSRILANYDIISNQLTRVLIPLQGKGIANTPLITATQCLTDSGQCLPDIKQMYMYSKIMIRESVRLAPRSASLAASAMHQGHWTMATDVELITVMSTRYQPAA